MIIYSVDIHTKRKKKNVILIISVSLISTENSILVVLLKIKDQHSILIHIDDVYIDLFIYNLVIYAALTLVTMLLSLFFF